MYCPWDGIAETAEHIANARKSSDEWSSVFLGAEHAEQAPALVEALNERGVRFFGAIFPGLINGSEWSANGLLLNQWRMVTSPRFVRLGESEFDWNTNLPSLAGASNGKVTALVLVDFWSRQVSRLLDELFDHYGNTVNYVGAGCGVGQRRHSDCILTSTGCHEASASVVFLDTASTLELRHGWRRISEPLVATRTTGNIIQEFNWEPSLEVYRTVVGTDVANSLRDTFRPEAKRFPFGISREDEEDVVRDPMALTDTGGLVCLSDVPENSVMHILHGEVEGLVQAAEEATRDCFSIPIEAAAQSLIFDCYSRALLLGDNFSQELTAIANAMSESGNSQGPLGVLALGEIASDGNRLPEFHNKTVVVVRFHD